MNESRLLRVLVGALPLFLNGCGLSVPEIGEAWDRQMPGDPPLSGTAQIEFEVRKKVYCELKDAVQYVNGFKHREGASLNALKNSSLALPRDWGAQVSLSLEVDESSAANPGLGLVNPMPNSIKSFGPGNTVTTAQSFTMGLGGTLSATATRIDKFDPYYSVDWLMQKDKKDSICYKEKDNDPLHGELAGGERRIPATSSPLLQDGDLGLTKWLTGAVFADLFLPSRCGATQGDGSTDLCGSSSGGQQGGGNSGGGNSGAGTASGGGALGPYSLSTEIKFIIVSSGNVSPSWKLVTFTANTGSSPLLSAGRTRTHDLIITIGPATAATQGAHQGLVNANEMGNAVRAAQTPLP